MHGQSVKESAAGGKPSCAIFLTGLVEPGDRRGGKPLECVLIREP